MALAVWGVSRWIKRPALLHLLWVLVLLRMVVPPVFMVDLSGVKNWLGQVVQSGSEGQAAIYRKVVNHSKFLSAVTRASSDYSIRPVRNLFETDVDGAQSEVVQPLAPVRNMVGRTAELLAAIARNAPCLLLPIWLTGTAICLSLQMWSTFRFRQSVGRHSYRSRIWQRRTRKVAARMRISTCPEIFLVRARVSPMLWGFGSHTRLLFPERLLEALSVRAQNTLIAHELAHYRRGDQWVRMLELISTALFWWHPVLWWARREIERYEEHCCDAWAVRIASGCPRTYAEALLATVDFVSAAVLPPVASGASHSWFLRQRLLAIMVDRPTRRRNLLPEGYPGMLTLALLILLPTPAIWQKQLPLPARALTVTGAQTAVATIGTKDRSPVQQPKVRSPQPMLRLDDAQRGEFLNASTGARRTFEVGSVSSAAFSQDGALLAVGTGDGKVQLLQCENAELVREFEIGYGSVSTVDISPDGTSLVAGSRDGVCRVIDLEERGRPFFTRSRRGAAMQSASFSLDGRSVAVIWNGHRSQRLEVWNLDNGRVTNRLLTSGPGDEEVKDTSRYVGLIPSSGELDARNPDSWMLVSRDGRCWCWTPDGEVLVSSRVLDAVELDSLRISRGPDLHRANQ